MPWRMASAIVITPPCARNARRVIAKQQSPPATSCSQKFHPKTRTGMRIEFRMPARFTNSTSLPLWFAGVRIQEQPSVDDSRMAEVEVLGEGAGDRIERTVSDAGSVQPVVFDEVDDRGLIRHGVVDEVGLRPR